MTFFSLILLLFLITPPAHCQDTLNLSMLNAVNSLRLKGCQCGNKNMAPAAPLTWNAKLAAAARRQVLDMVKTQRLSHTGSDHSTVGKRASDAGYNWSTIGENIAEGSDSVEDVMALWTGSPGHCSNMMEPAFHHMGAAQKGEFWVQVFGNGR